MYLFYSDSSTADLRLSAWADLVPDFASSGAGILCMHIYIYIYMYIHVYIYIYICINMLQNKANREHMTS